MIIRKLFGIPLLTPEQTWVRLEMGLIPENEIHENIAAMINVDPIA